MKAVQASKAGSDWEVVEQEILSPGPGTVRVKVEVCGIRHSDMLVKEGYWQVAREKATGVAKEGSPISRLLDTTVTMEAKLEG